MSWVLAIETGGTFTDLFLLGPKGRVLIDKVPSTPEAPEKAAIAALQRGLELANIEANSIARILHGSTVAVNALIERSATPPVLITTQGFRDMLFIARQDKTHNYDMFYRKPEPFTDRARVYEVNGRIGADGSVIEELDLKQVSSIAQRIVDEVGSCSVAVCLLHSYANPVHERAIGELISQRHPELHVTLSSNVCPLHREFERASTTVINAYLRPVVDKYLQGFAEDLRAHHCLVEPLIMQANGGVLPVSETRQLPAGLYLSGPSAAARGAAQLGEQANHPSLISIDVGGTSTDICLITDGETHEAGHGGDFGTVSGQPLNLVMTDIITIGAGGGSIAWIDDGAMLRVGPQSAGADPGPACYARGGTKFTLTDAMLLLGLLADGGELPGGICLSAARAREAGQPLADTLDLDTTALADATYRIAIANMAEAIRSATVHRGLDPRDYALFACGGVGPMVAARVAEELQIDKLLVPPDAGVFSAFGLTAAGLRMDFVRALNVGAPSMNELRGFGDLIDSLQAEAMEAFARLDASLQAVVLILTADARYKGQGYELRVPLDFGVAYKLGSAHVAKRFHDVHKQRYGHSFTDQSIEVTALRMTAAIPATVELSHWRAGNSNLAEDSRRLLLDATPRKAPLVERAHLVENTVVGGAAILVEATTSTLVPAGWRARHDKLGLLHLERSPAS